MAMPLTTLHDVLDLELEKAVAALNAAREARQHKDTPHHRSLVAQAWECVDAILDLVNETERRAVVE